MTSSFHVQLERDIAGRAASVAWDELPPQLVAGALSEGEGRLAAGGALAVETGVFTGRTYLMETSIRADFAFIRAHRADTHGNLVYRRSARNFHPPFSTAANVTIAEVDNIVEPGQLDPEAVATPVAATPTR